MLWKSFLVYTECKWAFLVNLVNEAHTSDFWLFSPWPVSQALTVTQGSSDITLLPPSTEFKMAQVIKFPYREMGVSARPRHWAGSLIKTKRESLSIAQERQQHHSQQLVHIICLWSGPPLTIVSINRLLRGSCCTYTALLRFSNRKPKYHEPLCK